MDKTEVNAKLVGIFRNVFGDNSLILRDDLTANDVDKWDSLTHMLLVSEVEDAFSIKFKLKDLNKMRNVGDMVEIIVSKLENN